MTKLTIFVRGNAYEIKNLFSALMMSAQQKRIKNFKGEQQMNRLIFLLTIVVMLMLSGVAAKKKPTHIATIPIEDLITTAVVGDVTFKAPGTTLEAGTALNVDIDIKDGKPDTAVLIFVRSDPNVFVAIPILRMHWIDGKGKLKYSTAYGIKSGSNFWIEIEERVEGGGTVPIYASQPIALTPKP